MKKSACKLFDGIKRIVFWRPGDRAIAAMCLVMFIVLLVPLVRIMPYASAWYDDYDYGANSHYLWEEQGTVASVIRGAALTSYQVWCTWQGTFTSTFFMGLVPVTFGEQYYFLGPLFILSVFVAGSFFLTGVLLRKVVGARWSLCMVMQVAVTSVMITFMHTSKTGIYWYNSGVHYTAMHAFCMMMTGFCVLLLYEIGRGKAILWILLACLGAFLSGGSNYVTSLQGMLLVLLLAALGVLFHRRRAWRMLPVLAVYGVAFYLNVTAPGNAVRGGNFSGMGYSAMAAVRESFLEVFRRFWGFTGWRMIVCLVLLVPVMWRIAGESRVRFRWPLPVAVLCICFCATGYTSSFYTVGHTLIGRTINASKMTFQMLLLFYELYLIGWFRQRLENRDGSAAGWLKGRKQPVWWFYAGMAALFLLVFFRETNPAGNYASFAAYHYMHTGEIYNFYQQNQERLELFRSDEPEIVVEHYRYTPWILCQGDLSEDPNADENRSIARWYHKSSVRCSAPEPEQE